MSARLDTKYLGLNLQNPLVASAGPLTGRLDTLHALEDAGVAAVVLPSLFEEQIEHDDIEAHRLFMYQTESFAESLSHLPEIGAYPTGPDEYLARLTAAKKELGIPVIASLNGRTTGGWVRYAKLMEEAGADALELNIYMVADDACEPGAIVEGRYIDLVTAVRETVRLPLAVKIGCQFSSLPNFVQLLVHAGADGVVLFNRYLEPDIDLDRLEVSPSLHLSQRHELRLPLRWIAILRDQTRASLAASSGIHTAGDVLKALLVGADVAMMTSALLQSGPRLARGILSEVCSWLDEREYESVNQLRGSMSRKNCPDPGAFERANYMRALTSYTSDLPAPQPGR